MSVAKKTTIPTTHEDTLIIYLYLRDGTMWVFPAICSTQGDKGIKTFTTAVYQNPNGFCGVAWERFALLPVGCGRSLLAASAPKLTGGAGPVFCGCNGAGIWCCWGIGGTGGAD